LATTNDVQMQMENTLTGVSARVREDAITAFGDPDDVSDLGRNGQQFPSKPNIIWSQVVQRRNVLPGNDEDVGGSLRVKIAESNNRFHLHHEYGWNLPARNSTENAGDLRLIGSCHS